MVRTDDRRQVDRREAVDAELPVAGGADDHQRQDEHGGEDRTADADLRELLHGRPLRSRHGGRRHLDRGPGREVAGLHDHRLALLEARQDLDGVAGVAPRRDRRARAPCPRAPSPPSRSRRTARARRPGPPRSRRRSRSGSRRARRSPAAAAPSSCRPRPRRSASDSPLRSPGESRTMRPGQASVAPPCGPRRPGPRERSGPRARARRAAAAAA